MRTPLAIALATTTALAGFAVGMAVDRSTGAESADAVRTREDAKANRERADADDDERDRRRAQGDGVSTERSVAAGERIDERTAADRDPVGGGDPPVGESGDADDPARRERELVAAADACVELLGKPVEAPVDVPERFSRAALSHAVGTAIEQAGVPGDVEGVDCSEFPCIVFGRLAGDEEDVEEIERSAALDPYEGDVLTLLLWATTVDESARTHPTAKETGLFALAYHDADDRAELGADLDRRIRARVLEVWNAERSGPPGSAL
jgi:hypothetical protein